MNIYVPSHLRKIKIMEDLCSMVLEYSSKYKSTDGSFDDYQIYLKIDPVRRFIGLCLNEMEIEQDYETVLNYLTRLFYSVKGTYNVFLYIKRYLGLRFVDDYVLYTSRILSFTLENTVGDDIGLFDEYFRAFLYNLIYVEKLDYGVKNLKESIEDDLDFYGGLGIKTYKRFNEIVVEENDV